jgi:hypothetical protein
VENLGKLSVKLIWNCVRSMLEILLRISKRLLRIAMKFDGGIRIEIDSKWN